MKNRFKLIIVTLTLVVIFYHGPISSLISAVIFRMSLFKLNIAEQSEDAVTFYMWTHPSRLEYRPVQLGNLSSLLAAGYNSSWPVKVLIHGFGDSGITSWTDRLRKAYFTTGKYNIISVDWELMATSPWYATAVKNTEVVGRVTARLLVWMVADAGCSWERVHVLGSSLGAHAAGYTGRFTGGRVHRVTGLDPSGPLFHTVNEKDRLDRSDGQFVDVIHTAGRWVGDEDPLGDVDFIVNGGRAPQPGCETKESLDLSCSHFRAWQLYTQSVYAQGTGQPSDWYPKITAISCLSYDMLKAGSCCRWVTSTCQCFVVAVM